MEYNSLLIETSQFGFGFDLEILPWDQGLTSYRVYQDGEREELEGNLGVGFDSFGIGADDEWMLQIPASALRNTRHFCEYQLYMLWLAANSEVALDILIEQPLLLALVCSDCHMERADALAICNQGKKHILTSLGLDDSDLALSFVNKLNFTYEYGHELTYVRKYLGSKRDHRRFMHYTTVNDMVIAIDQSTPDLTGSKLSLALSKSVSKHVWSKAGFIRSALALGEKLEITNAVAMIKNCHDYAEVKALHKGWGEQQFNSVDKEKTPTNQVRLSG